jgi:prepilin-type N-terminal cleavage/methylation domain-containing protein
MAELFELSRGAAMNRFSQRRRLQRYKGPVGKRSILSIRQRVAGITLPEVLVVIVIVGILMAILAPGWLGLQTNNLLKTAQDEAFQAMRQAQMQALNTNQTWRVGFRQAERVEWATFPASSQSGAHWHSLLSGVRIALDETTLRQDSQIYFVEFNYKGHVTPPFGRLSLASNRGDRKRRCVFVSTLLGVLRKAADGECYR